VSDVKEFKLPDVGEGLTEADILSWRVAVGDTVEVNQVIVEVETAKAAVELPSPWAGVVTVLHCAEGDTVDVGRPIIAIEVAPGAAAGGADSAGVGAGGRAAGGSDGAADGGTDAYGVYGEGAPKRQPVLVGYGPREGADGAGSRRRRRTSTAVGTDVAPPRPRRRAPPARSPCPRLRRH
jgi:pyruvate dehydrogenase E2 component (dihydrolipoamide acetyltransferase)